MQKLDIKQNPYQKVRKIVKSWGLYDEAFEKLLAVRSNSIQYLYTTARNLKPFFKEWLKKMPKEFVEICKTDPQKATDIIAEFVMHRADTVSPGDGSHKLKAIRALLEMNHADKEIEFKLIRKHLPQFSTKARDKAVPKDTAIMLYSYGDIRQKVLMQLLAHGLRVGAFYFDVQKDQHRRGYYDYLKFEDLSIITQNSSGYQEIPFIDWIQQDKKEQITCGRLIVYREEKEECTPLLTPECVYTIADYYQLRKDFGEDLNAESPILRNIMTVQDKMITGSLRTKNAKQIQPLAASGIARLMNHLYYQYSIRKGKVQVHKGRHEFKTVHGWRKLADTTFKTYMRHDYAEYQLGHLEHYFRPELKDHIEEFKKVTPNLSLDKAKNLERELETRDKEYYEKIRTQVSEELESEFLAKYKDEIRKIAISAIKEINTSS